MKQMRVLHVVRHAKSSWDYNGTADIDRTLKTKGIRNAYEMARRLKLSQQVPQKIITSPANRALHTAVIFARVLGYPLSTLEISNVLYESSAEKILEMIWKSDDSLQSVMICGHNPDFTDLVNHFLKVPVDNIPTSGSVTLTFNAASWKDIDRKNLEKHLVNFPEKDE